MPQPVIQVISVARKPLSASNVAANIQKWGTGGLDIGRSRVGVDTRTYTGSGASPQKLDNHGPGDTGVGLLDGRGRDLQITVEGRWPANVILAHQPGCKLAGTKQVGSGDKIVGGPPRSKSAHIQQMSEQPRTEAIMSYGTETVDNWACTDNCVVADLGEQSGAGGPSGWRLSGPSALGQDSGWHPHANRPVVAPQYNDSGTAARFYKQFQRTDAMSLQPPQELVEYLHTMITPSGGETLVALDLTQIQWDKYTDNQMHGMIILGDPEDYLDHIWRVLRPGGFLMAFAPPDHPVGYRSACAIEDRGFEIRDAICLAREPGALHYFPKASSSERNAGLAGDRNVHPTIKPVGLMKKLLNKVPPDQKVLDPFAGSGTTGVAAVHTGHSVTLIDREKEYCEIATARIKHADREKVGWVDVQLESDTPLTQEPQAMSLGDLFGFGEEKE